MLSLDGACLLHEWILTLEREDGLGGHVLRLVPRSISVVAMVRQMDDVSKVSSVSFGGQAVFMPHRLDPIDHLDWGAAKGGWGVVEHTEDCGYSYDISIVTCTMSHSTTLTVQGVWKFMPRNVLRYKQ